MNTLSVSLQHSILTLADGKRSQRDIAKLLGIHRETVARYLRLAASKPAILPAGSEPEPAKVPTGFSSARAVNVSRGGIGLSKA